MKDTIGKKLTRAIFNGLAILFFTVVLGPMLGLLWIGNKISQLECLAFHDNDAAAQDRERWKNS